MDNNTCDPSPFFPSSSGCYVSMYMSIRGHDPNTARSDLTVAKRMALLVFTDFACWAPVSFFGWVDGRMRVRDAIGG